MSYHLDRFYKFLRDWHYSRILCTWKWCTQTFMSMKYVWRTEKQVTFLRCTRALNSIFHVSSFQSISTFRLSMQIGVYIKIWFQIWHFEKRNAIILQKRSLLNMDKRCILSLKSARAELKIAIHGCHNKGGVRFFKSMVRIMPLWASLLCI